MLRTWIIYSVTLISTFIFFLFYKMWVSWYCLIAILIIPVLALIAAVFSTNSLGFKFDMPSNTTIGDPVYLTLSVTGFATFFSFAKIEIAITDNMAGTTRNVAVYTHDSGATKIPVDTSHCGAYTYKITKVSVYDLLGFFRFGMLVKTSNEILVRPVPSVPDIMPNMYGFKAKSLRKSNKANSELYDIREYEKGDPIKSIHWKISAKKDKLYVKEPLEEFGGHSRVILKLTEDRDEMDNHLGQLVFTSRFFLDHEIPHKIRVMPPNQSEIAFGVENTTDLERAIVSILHIRIPKDEEELTDAT
jgi:uncharacterized protein (DUF58 family)